MRYLPSLLALSILLPGCMAPLPVQAPDIQPYQAILAAAENRGGVTGVFALKVRGSGRQDDRLYLNSEADYRDQRCLTIAIPQDVERSLEAKFGGDLASILTGREIRVTGTAKRVTIWINANGVRTDRYYYQTHVLISDASQITLATLNR